MDVIKNCVPKLKKKKKKKKKDKNKRKVLTKICLHNYFIELVAIVAFMKRKVREVLPSPNSRVCRTHANRRVRTERHFV